ncbi:MAG TPA: SprT family zinc-dependent metalloprotease [Verrucomicrobiae bacterium]|nr:SprT family zinc-dependent metalloprotease [Verrucomicrobiae bacterium]
MSTKVIDLAGVGPVTLIKRAGSRTIRLTVTANGTRVSMPKWIPYSAGQAFALQHIQWITTELAKQTGPHLAQGQSIGKMHHLRFEHVSSDESIAGRVTGTEIIVKMRTDETIDSKAVQGRAAKTSIRALKREAERLLPPRLANLAAKYEKRYTSVGVKQLKRRWGSCDSHQNIVLNLFLMELPWDYIDYVLLHELAHTIELNHSDAFWRELKRMQPRARDLARQLHEHQPIIGAWH